MIKKILLAICVAMPSMVFAQKFGTINTETLTQQLPEMKEVQTQLEAASKKYEDEFQNLQQEFQKKFTEFQNMEETTPQTIKDRRMQELQELDQKIQQFRQTATEDLQRQQQQLLAPVMQKVQAAIQSVGQEGNFTFIFENTVPVYVGGDVVDITQMVKTKLGVQ